MLEAPVQGHAIQGLIKFHGLQDEVLRIPYHSSISVCAKEIYTVTLVVKRPDKTEDIYMFNGKPATGRELERIIAVVGRVRELGRLRGYDVDTGLEFDSSNYIGLPPHAVRADSKGAKGLGFSSASFPTYAYGTAEVLGLDFITENPRLLSSIARRGSTSASRGAAGGYAKLYMPAANSKDPDLDCFAEQIAPITQFPEFRMVIFPMPSSYGTEEAHREAAKSPLFPGRLEYLKDALPEMEKAIISKDFKKMCDMAETDTVSLHDVTESGPRKLIYQNPESVIIKKRVVQLREKGIQARYSLDTGPSVFVNTEEKYVNDVINAMGDLGITPIVCHAGEEVHLVDKDFLLSLPKETEQDVQNT